MFLVRDGRLNMTLPQYWDLEPSATGALVRLVSGELKDEAKLEGDLRTAEMSVHTDGYTAIVKAIGYLGRGLARLVKAIAAARGR